MVVESPDLRFESKVNPDVLDRFFTCAARPKRLLASPDAFSRSLCAFRPSLPFATWRPGARQRRPATRFR